MTEAEQAIAKGLTWLLAQQAADGGWHSTTYGQLKDGAAITALALDAISRTGQSGKLPKAQADVVAKGFAFLRRGLDKRGTIAGPDGSLDFPTYAAALWLSAARRLGLASELHDERSKVVEYLLAAQVAQPRGFEADSPSYGGWDFLGKGDAQGITTGTNISVTCFVLEALSEELASERASGGRKQASGGRKPTEPLAAAISLGKAYTLRCQQPGGGFAFTCEPASLNNKAAFLDPKLTQPRPYGTATCDGIRALVACGLKPADEPLAKALAWVVPRPGLEAVPGFETLPPEAGWHRGLRYYYYASLARVVPLMPSPDREPRRAALIKHVAALQHKNGFWKNESDRMRENDPLIATPLALAALA